MAVTLNNTEAIITNLIVTSRVGINDKLVVEGGKLNIQPQSSWRALWRWWYSETRLASFNAVHALMSAACNMIELQQLRGNQKEAMPIAEILPQALRGVKNLSETYRDDVEACAKFQMLISDIERFLLEHELDRASASPTPSYAELHH